jgi:membrane protein
MSSSPTRRPRRFEVLWNIKGIIVQTARAWFEHDAATIGAALAFYTVSSVAPILIIAIGAVGLVIGPETVSGTFVASNAKSVWRRWRGGCAIAVVGCPLHGK